VSGTLAEFRAERLCVVGVGLIGGSLARALRRAGACAEVVGAGRRVATLERALELGVIDRFETDPAAAAAGADVVVVAVPLGATEEVLHALAPALAAGAVLTDVGSAKRCIIEAARAAFGEVPARLVPGHPIAGTERAGVEASFAELFDGHRVILTPLAETDADASARVAGMWRAAGAEVLTMDPAHHDAVLAATSHLPHLLAYTLVDVLGGLESGEEIFRYAAGGFRDFTRIASSDPNMWHDICLANADEIADALAAFQSELARVGEAIRRGDSEALRTLFERAKRLRDSYLPATAP